MDILSAHESKLGGRAVGDSSGVSAAWNYSAARQLPRGFDNLGISNEGTHAIVWRRFAIRAYKHSPKTQTKLVFLEGPVQSCVGLLKASSRASIVENAAKQAYIQTAQIVPITKWETQKHELRGDG